jgi:Secretion system C-terminal sorting domain
MKRWLNHAAECAAIVLLTMSLSNQESHAHAQHVHQYIIKEAYELLRSQHGDIPEMQNHVGGLEQFYAGAYAWQLPYLTTGAWREDVEDPVFGYRLNNLLNNYSLVSISHFWDADQGDLNTNLFRVNPVGIPFDIGPYENSYDKLMRYATGGWILWFQDTIIVQQESNGHFLLLSSASVPDPFPFRGVPLAYDTLVNFYKNHRMSLRTDVLGAYVVFDINTQTFIANQAPIDILVFPEVRDRIVWEALGRMCHLLGDLSVPAHTRRDEHGLDPDSYENWMGGSGQPYTVWNASNAGPLVDPYTPDNDPLHYLMYTLQQQTNHFGSNGPYESCGNDVTGGAGRPAEIAFLQGIGLSSYGLPVCGDPFSTANLENIRNHTFPYAIRATAGLLYWFAREAALITVGVREQEEDTPERFSLEQNYPNPFNPTTDIGFEIGDFGLVRLSVYDLLGREVAVLVDERRASGYYKVRFNAAGLSSGVYFTTLHAGDFVQTRKIVLMR